MPKFIFNKESRPLIIGVGCIFLMLLGGWHLNADTLHWTSPRPLQVAPEQTKNHLYFKEAHYSPRQWSKLPLYTKSIPLEKGGDIQVSLENTKYKALTTPEVLDPTEKNRITTTPIIRSEITYQRKQPVASITIVPLRKHPNKGNLQRLVSFDIKINIQSSRSAQKTQRSVTYAKNSILRQGQWYKFSVKQPGMYQLDYEFLQELGVNVDQINPQNLRIYGQKGGMLPESNDVASPTSLQEHALAVKAGNDGSFNEGDYIIMYAEGPHKWYYDTSDQHYHYRLNHYATKNYYFLTTDHGPGRRINTQSSVGGATKTVTSFDAYAVHEKDQNNLLGSGRQWFGTAISSQDTRQVSFSFPHRVTNKPIDLNMRIAGRSKSGTHRFRLSANNTSITNFTIGAVGGSYTSLYARTKTITSSFTDNNNNITLSTHYTPPDNAAKAWIDYIELNARRHLKMEGDQMHFRDSKSVDSGATSKFVISDVNTSITVWEVTDPLSPKKQSTTKSGSKVQFTVPTEHLRDFVAFTGNNFNSPTAEGKVDNQNLHGTSSKDMLIISAQSFLSEAKRLAQFHRKEDDLSVKVVTQQEVFNEFSSGRPDIAAIRNFVKMFYDRAGGNTEQMPDYLLLFGDGSYDYKNLNDQTSNTNYILTFQSQNSLDPVHSFTSDDFFGLLDDNEGGNIRGGKVDIGIGRLTVKSETEAEEVVDKIMHYASPKTQGPWRNNITFVADDEDGNTHINQANTLTHIVRRNHPIVNIDKIFFDAFQQTSTAGGERYPNVNEEINSKIFKGTFIMNYTGHGGELGWAHERVLGVEDITSWENYDKLPLLVTATCEFSRYDDPALTSAGEQTLLSSKGGSIGLMTTTRLVYASENQAMAKSFYRAVFSPIDGNMPRLGDIARIAKNNTSTGEGNRKFGLIGDPALQLNYPQHKVTTTKVNQTPVTASQPDTLKALEKVTVHGLVQDKTGEKLSNFNGVLFPTIFDKPQTIQTLANDPGSNKRTFKLQNNVLFNGKASVNNGAFQFSFIVPKDINYRFGNGKISYYAKNNKTDATGAFQNVIIGGAAQDPAEDNKGPNIDIFMNDKKFVFGGITDEDPQLIVELFDKSGINTVSNGIGHDIKATLDEKKNDVIILNEFYESELDNFKEGEVRYPLSNLEEGRHELNVKAWDVYNNSGEGYTEFVVAPSEDLALSHVLNYPNPFTSQTNFQFEHNRPGDILNVRIEIFTIAGQLIKTIHTQVMSEGYRVNDIRWNGLDDFGDKIGKGVYVYKLRVETSQGEVAHKFQKLVILK